MDPTPLPATTTALEPEVIRATTREVLARPEFPVDVSLQDNAIFETLRGLLRNILDTIAGWAVANPILSWTVFILLSLFLLALIGHLLYSSFSSDVAGQAGTGKRARYEMLEGEGRSWQEGLSNASLALDEHDLRRAVWIAHRVLLGILDEEDALQFAGAKTNEAYLRECQTDHPLASTLVSLTLLYDEIIYGHLQVDPSRLTPLIHTLKAYDLEASTRRQEQPGAAGRLKRA